MDARSDPPFYEAVKVNPLVNQVFVNCGFQDVNLEAAIVNAMYAAVIESEFDYAQVAEALGDFDDSSKLATTLLKAMGEYHSAGTVRFDGVRIPHLYPGEGFVISCAIFPGTAVFIFLRLAGKNCTRGNIVSSEHPGLGLPSSKSR